MKKHPTKSPMQARRLAHRALRACCLAYGFTIDQHFCDKRKTGGISRRHKFYCTERALPSGGNQTKIELLASELFPRAEIVWRKRNDKMREDPALIIHECADRLPDGKAAARLLGDYAEEAARIERKQAANRPPRKQAQAERMEAMGIRLWKLRHAAMSLATELEQFAKEISPVK